DRVEDGVANIGVNGANRARFLALFPPRCLLRKRGRAFDITFSKRNNVRDTRIRVERGTISAGVTGSRSDCSVGTEWKRSAHGTARVPSRQGARAARPLLPAPAPAATAPPRLRKNCSRR